MSFGKRKPATGMTGGVKRKRRPKAPSKVLWELCRKIIRKRYPPTCYTCGKTGLEGSNLHTGHFIPKSICSTELKYSLDNLRPQCYHCNINLSGNWPAFERHLEEEMGKGYVAELKERNQLSKGISYGSSWFTQTIAEYENMV